VRPPARLRTLPGPRLLRLPEFRHPAQVVVVAFAVAILFGTILLSLPAAREGAGHASFVTALFTSTSAVCVTGLVVVDTPSYWSQFGEAVILALIQVGGFGIMTLASLLGMLVSHRLGLRSRLNAAAETKSLGIGDVRTVVLGVLRLTVLFEVATAAVLGLRFGLGYGMGPGQAPTTASSTRSRRSTMQASRCTPTASPGTSPTRGSASRWPSR